MRNVTYLPGVEIALILTLVEAIWEKSLASYEERRARNEPFDGPRNLQRLEETLLALRAIYGMDVEGTEKQVQEARSPPSAI